MYFELYKDGLGYWRWRLKAANHRVIADGAEGYHNKLDAIGGVNLVKSTTHATPVYEYA